MKIFFISLIVFVGSLAFSQAAGIQVSPSKLEFAVSDEAVTHTLTVHNPTSDVQVFRVYTDDHARIIRINPASFTLEAGKEQQVQVAVTPAEISSPTTTIVTTLSVVGAPLLDGTVPVGAGAKIEVRVTKDSNSPVPLYVLLPLGAVLLGGVTLLVSSFRRKRI